MLRSVIFAPRRVIKWLLKDGEEKRRGEICAVVVKGAGNEKRLRDEEEMFWPNIVKIRVQSEIEIYISDMSQSTIVCFFFFSFFYFQHGDRDR